MCYTAMTGVCMQNFAAVHHAISELLQTDTNATLKYLADNMKLAQNDSLTMRRSEQGSVPYSGLP